MPVLYRDAPLNSIWEGSGNVAALDVLRAMVKEPEGLPAFLAECELAAGGDARLDAHLARVREEDGGGVLQRRSAVPRAPGRRGPRGGPAGVAAGALLARRRWPTRSARRGSPARADGCSGRFPAGVDAKAIIDRALPV